MSICFFTFTFFFYLSTRRIPDPGETALLLPIDAVLDKGCDAVLEEGELDNYVTEADDLLMELAGSVTRWCRSWVIRLFRAWPVSYLRTL